MSTEQEIREAEEILDRLGRLKNDLQKILDLSESALCMAEEIAVIQHQISQTRSKMWFLIPEERGASE